MSSMSYDKQPNLFRHFKTNSLPWIIDVLNGSFMTDMVLKSHALDRFSQSMVSGGGPEIQRRHQLQIMWYVYF